jgi:hypothetical protein
MAHIGKGPPYLADVSNRVKAGRVPLSESLAKMPTMNNGELLAAVERAIGSAKVIESFEAPIGRGIWFRLSSGNLFSIERRGEGWDLADVTACLWPPVAQAGRIDRRAAFP